MTVHLHVHDCFTTTTGVGIYNTEGGNTVFLHGEDHLRGRHRRLRNPAAGMAAFQNTYGPRERRRPLSRGGTRRRPRGTCPLARSNH